MDRFLIFLVTVVFNIILMSAAFFVYSKSYPKQQRQQQGAAEVFVKQNIGCCDDNEETTNINNHVLQNSATRIIFQPQTASVGSMQEDGIIRGWLLNEKLLEKGKNYPNINLAKDVFRINEKGNYTISSLISFWRRERPDTYDLIIDNTNRPHTNPRCQNASNPNILSCCIKTVINVIKPTSFYFKVKHSDAKVLMSSNYASVALTMRV